MFGLENLAFTSPFLLTALLGLPLLYWLLRATPPAPQTVVFPPVNWIRDLLPTKTTAQKTPWWLILLRMLLCALIIFALAGPVTNKQTMITGKAPLLLVIDNSWQSGSYWHHQQQQLLSLLERANTKDRHFFILPLAPNATDHRVSVSAPLPYQEAKSEIMSLRPLPWMPDFKQAKEALRTLPEETSSQLTTFWFSGKTRPRHDAQEFDAFKALLQASHLKVTLQERVDMIVTIQPADKATNADLVLSAQTAIAQERTFTLAFYNAQNIMLHEQDVHLPALQKSLPVTITAPTLLKNQMSYAKIRGQNQAGATILFDRQWRKYPVGIAVSSQKEKEKPLLASVFYLEKALKSSSELSTLSLEQLLNAPPSVLIFSDIGELSDQQSDTLKSWIDQGGVLIRFAGPRLAEKGNKVPFLPVQLRTGGRALGGAMSWSEPAKLGAFPESSPLYGLDVPADVTIRRQVLAEPTPDLQDKVWALLSDGTPLITAQEMGKGYTILIHTTANTDWSNLALSGLYVEILQRLVRLSDGIAPTQEEASALQPLRLLSGVGVLEAPTAGAVSLNAADADKTSISSLHPAGFYGDETNKMAFNFTTHLPASMTLSAKDFSSSSLTSASTEQAKDWKGPLLSMAIILLFFDYFCTRLLQKNMLSPLRVLALSCLFALFFGISLANAQFAVSPYLKQTEKPIITSPEEFDPQSDDYAIAAADTTWLAFVKTGDRSLDAISRNGLENLSTELYDRTAIEPAGVVGLDLEKEDLSFYPVIFWPISPAQPDLSSHAVENVNKYIHNGGLIIFDTRDANISYSGGETANQKALKRLVRHIDLPPIEKVPSTHVLTKSFFLLDHFPGHYDGKNVWVEQSKETVNDGVSTVILGGNDWLGGWATTAAGLPLYPIIPNGDRQRELSFRFGINIMMYALTGNYKADQIHVPSILERLGQ